MEGLGESEWLDMGISGKTIGDEVVISVYMLGMEIGIVILIVNEELYHRSKLEHSLINSNQIRHYGVVY